MKSILFFLVTSMLVIPPAFASKEGVLKLNTFSLESKGIAEFGPVKVVGEQSEQNEVKSLSVEAFGKKIELKPEDLSKIPKQPYNGIQLSYEQGYPEMGGKTVYITLQFGFTSQVKQRVLVTITEKGEIKIKELP